MTWFNQKYFLVLFLKLLFIVVIGRSLGLFTVINDYVYDMSFETFRYPDQNHKEFTLIDASGINKDALSRLLETLDKNQPRLIVADIFHTRDTLDKQHLEVIEGLNTTTIFTTPIENQILDILTKQDVVITYALNEQVHTNGNQNYQYINNYFNQTNHSIIFDKKLSINYNGNPPFTKIYATDVLQQHVISELLNDRIIIVSTLHNTYAHSQHTEVMGNEFIHMNYLAFMLKSALSDTWLKTFSIELYYAYIMLYSIAVIFLLYILSKYIQYLIIILVLFVVMLYWAAISFYYVMLPISELIIIILTTSRYLLLFWQRLNDKEEEKVIRTMSNRLQEKIVHTSFFNSNESWNELINLVSELFVIEKSIFLEKVENDHYMKEIISNNCKFCDIFERRRDYTREPYTSVVKTRHAQEIDRQFFKESEENEVEFIAPLIYFNEVVGFWIFTIYKEQIIDRERLLNDMTLCSKEIARLVHDRNRFQIQKNNDQQQFSNKLRKVMDLEVKNSSALMIRNNFSVFMKRMYLNEILIDNIHSNIILYDFFGKVINVNNKMNILLQEENIKTYSMSASEMLSTLTKIELIDAVNLIRSIMFNCTKHEQVIYFKNSKKRYFLSMSAITKDKIENKFSTSYFADTYGVMFEFIDFSFVEGMIQTKENILYDSLKLSRSQLVGLNKIVEKRINNNLTEQQKTLLDKQISNMVNKVTASYKELEGIMEQDYLTKENDTYPIDIVSIVKSVCDTLKEEYPIKHVKVDLIPLSYPVYVRASLKKMYRYLRILLVYLADDCEENGTITVQMGQGDGAIEILMQSSGTGMPNEQLEAYIRSNKVVDFEELKNDIESWNGIVELSSALGEGVYAHTSFKVVTL